MPRKPWRVRTTKVPTTACPACHAEISAYAGTGTLRPGHVVICSSCSVYITLATATSFRLLTDAEWLALPAEHRALLSHVRDGMTRFRE